MTTDAAYILLTILLFVVLVIIFTKKRDRSDPLKNIPEGEFQKKAKKMIADKQKMKP